MSLTPEQIAQGWRLHDGSDVCPIKDDRTVFEAVQETGFIGPGCGARQFLWRAFSAYRIIEAHGADAEPARPTPFPASMDDLVYDEDGISQPFFTDGKWPEWLPDDSEWTPFAEAPCLWNGKLRFENDLAIRVRRREPKRETVRISVEDRVAAPRFQLFGTIDLIDGKPDLSTLKIVEDAL